MNVILIAAITLDGYIARKNDEVITWSKDLKLFKEQTMGCPVIMGSNTYKTLAVDLEGRDCIIVHKNDDPVEVLSKVKTEKCFVIGGGMTNTKFVKQLTHLYVTPHPILFGGGIKLFTNMDIEINLKLIATVPVDEEIGIFQQQYVVVR